MGVPLVIIHFSGIFPKRNHPASYWGTPIFRAGRFPVVPVAVGQTDGQVKVALPEVVGPRGRQVTKVQMKSRFFSGHSSRDSDG